MSRTLYDKIWDAHLVGEEPDGTALLYVDLHLLNEAGSAQAFAALKAELRAVRRPELAFAVADRAVPTEGQGGGVAAIRDPEAKRLVGTLFANAAEERIAAREIGEGGVGHLVAAELARAQPGMTVAAADAHAATLGALGAMGLAVTAADVEHVLATQTVRVSRARPAQVWVEGALALGVSATDLALAFVGRLGTLGGEGLAFEFAGPTVQSLSIGERMALCNLAVETGAETSLIAPDDKTFAYVLGREAAPRGGALQAALLTWKTLKTDPGARFDAEFAIDAAATAPMVSWGTAAHQCAAIDAVVPAPADPAARLALERMALEPGDKLAGLPVEHVSIGSCAGGRIEDLRAAARVAEGRRVAPAVRALVTPGTWATRRQAESEGLREIFVAAGFEWREPGCSFCFGLNGDRPRPGARAAATGNAPDTIADVHTHILSPAMAAAAAVTGRLTDVRELL